MRRIPLEVYNFANGLRAVAHVILRVEGLPMLPIRAIVDTGSPVTLLGTLDTKRMRVSKLQLNGLKGKNKPVNIGGGTITTKILEGAKLRFADSFEVEMSVDFPIEGGENFSQPSLLGVDFMLAARAKLFFDPNNRKAYFEIEE